MLARKELLGPVGERGLSGSSYTGGGIAALEDGARGLDSSSYGNDATAEENRNICFFNQILCMNYLLVMNTRILCLQSNTFTDSSSYASCSFFCFNTNKLPQKSLPHKCKSEECSSAHAALTSPHLSLSQKQDLSCYSGLFS